MGFGLEVSLGWAADLLSSSSQGYEEVSPSDFYRALFGNSRAYVRYLDKLELPLTMSDYDGEGSGTWRSVKLGDLVAVAEERNDAYLSPCTYFPKKSKDGRFRATNSMETADQLCAFVLDIDRPDLYVLKDCLEFLWPTKGLPCPTYVVCSGNGLHLYFVLDWPVDMMKRWRMELNAVKDYLGALYSTGNPSFTMIENAQSDNPTFTKVNSILGEFDNHGITQSYRVVGSRTKNSKETVTAWRTGTTWDIDDLAAIAGIHQRFTVEDFDLDSSMQTKAWEKESNRVSSRPDSGGKKKGWNPGLYKWLAAEVIDRAKYYGMYGHRYWQVLCLTIAARKDNIPEQQLEKDVAEAYRVWNDCASRWGHPKIQWAECQKAMRSGYRCDPYLVKKFKKDWLSDKCGWVWESHQKRRGRSQEAHLKTARNFKKWMYNEGVELKPDGRPKGSKDSLSRKPGSGRPENSGTKRQVIQDYAAAHPEANHSQIAAALGVSRPTVIKWLRETD